MKPFFASTKQEAIGSVGSTGVAGGASPGAVAGGAVERFESPFERFGLPFGRSSELPFELPLADAVVELPLADAVVELPLANAASPGAVAGGAASTSIPFVERFESPFESPVVVAGGASTSIGSVAIPFELLFEPFELPFEDGEGKFSVEIAVEGAAGIAGGAVEAVPGGAVGLNAAGGAEVEGSVAASITKSVSESKFCELEFSEVCESEIKSSMEPAASATGLLGFKI